MNGNDLAAVLKSKPSNPPPSRDAPLKCTDVARVLQQNFPSLDKKRRPSRPRHHGLHQTSPTDHSIRYEFINMVGTGQNNTDSSHQTLPPLYNYSNSLVRETSWYKFKTNNREERLDRLSPQHHQTPKLAYNHLKTDDRNSPDRRKKKQSNKENRVVNQKFLDYINRKRELTRQLHVDSNQVNMLERPGISPQNGMSGALKREATSIKDKIADYRRWREKEASALHGDDYKRERTELHNNDLLRQKTTMAKAKVEDLQDVRLLKKTLKEHDQRMDTIDGSRRSKNSKESKDSSIQAPHPAKKERPGSGGTWHTWRDVNTSYAYDDVKKYIEDNDLMSPSKETMIRRWAKDVDKHMSQIMGSGELPIISAVDERMSTDLTSSDSVRS